MAGDMESKISNYFIAAQKPLNKSSAAGAANKIEEQKTLEKEIKKTRGNPRFFNWFLT
jgi:hypothetical protein